MTETAGVTEDLLNSPSQQALIQEEMPFAVVRGEAVTEIPRDLYIPPDALEVFLEAFEGPLDLLLYLIKRQNLDIIDISIAPITGQYMQYIDLMDDMRLELAGEYLVMAAMLAEIKSRMLLPRPVEIEDEEDPRAELIRRLQEYERYKTAAEDLDELPRVDRDIVPINLDTEHFKADKMLPEVDIKELLAAMVEVVARADLFTNHQIQRETLSVRERMTQVLARVEDDKFVDFISLFTIEEGKLGVVVSFLAVLELVKGSLIDIAQQEQFAPIYVKAKG